MIYQIEQGITAIRFNGDKWSEFVTNRSVTYDNADATWDDEYSSDDYFYFHLPPSARPYVRLGVKKSLVYLWESKEGEVKRPLTLNSPHVLGCEANHLHIPGYRGCCSHSCWCVR